MNGENTIVSSNQTRGIQVQCFWTDNLWTMGLYLQTKFVSPTPSSWKSGHTISDIFTPQNTIFTLHMFCRKALLETFFHGIVKTHVCVHTLSAKRKNYHVSKYHRIGNIGKGVPWNLKIYVRCKTKNKIPC